MYSHPVGESPALPPVAPEVLARFEALSDTAKLQALLSVQQRFPKGSLLMLFVYLVHVAAFERDVGDLLFATDAEELWLLFGRWVHDARNAQKVAASATAFLELARRLRADKTLRLSAGVQKLLDRGVRDAEVLLAPAYDPILVGGRSNRRGKRRSKTQSAGLDAGQRSGPQAPTARGRSASQSRKGKAECSSRRCQAFCTKHQRPKPHKATARKA